MSGTDQVGGFVLWLGHVPVHLGETVRAVVVPFHPGTLQLWRSVQQGDELRMFEGARICGRAEVETVWSTEWPVPERDELRFIDWAKSLEGDR